MKACKKWYKITEDLKRKGIWEIEVRLKDAEFLSLENFAKFKKLLEINGKDFSCLLDLKKDKLKFKQNFGSLKS